MYLLEWSTWFEVSRTYDLQGVHFKIIKDDKIMKNRKIIWTCTPNAYTKKHDLFVIMSHWLHWKRKTLDNLYLVIHISFLRSGLSSCNAQPELNRVQVLKVIEKSCQKVFRISFYLMWPIRGQKMTTKTNIFFEG